MLVSVIVPAFNQAKTIKQDIENIYNTMSRTRWDFEILVIDDGSPDNTLQEAKKIKIDKVDVYGYPTNKGKGYAVRYGMARSTGDLIAFIDAGMDINPNSISMVLEHMEWYGSDIIVGSKRHLASKVDYRGIRKLYSWGYYLGVKFLFGLKIRDTQTGLKVFRREVLEKVLPRLLVKAFAFDIELLTVAYRLGFRNIHEAPVEVKLDFAEGSKWNKDLPLFLDPHIRGILIDTLAVFYRMKILRYYDEHNERKWKYDPQLQMRVNTGEFVAVSSNSDIPRFSDSTQERIKFSVIIPARAVNDHLRENFEHLKGLNYSEFEVISILDEKTDFDVKDSRFRFVVVGALSPGEKRNIGAKHATGEVLAFLDDDAYPSRSWLTEAARIFSTGSVYALGAPAITPVTASFLEKCSGRVLETFLASGFTVYRHLPRGRRLIDDYPTVNFFVRKRVFERIGGFTKEFWPGEDTKLCLDLVKRYGRNFLYSPEPLVYHHRRNLFLPHLKQISRYGRHRGQFASIFPETSRIPAYFVPSLFVLGLLLGPFLYYVHPIFLAAYFVVVVLYMGLVVYESTKAAIMDRSLSAVFLVAFGIIATHITYGINFMVGLIKKPELQLKSFDLQTGNYVEG